MKQRSRTIASYDNVDIKINALLSMHWSRLNKKAWIIVEGIDDKNLFDRLIPTTDIYISDSAVSRDGTGDCEKVMFIVKQMQRLTNQMPVVGIRDKDHLPFMPGKSRQMSKNILFTDKRDMENMILASTKTVHKITNIHPNFENNLKLAFNITRPIGILRIYNSIHQMCVNMKEVFSPVNTMQPNCLDWKEKGWQKMLVKLFNQNLPQKYRSNRKNLSLKKFASYCKNMISHSDDMVCQGHDVVKYLYHSKPFRKNVSIDDFYSLLYEKYVESREFYRTILYSDLKKWMKSNANVRI